MRIFNHSLPKNRNPKKEGKRRKKGEKESKKMKKLQKSIKTRKEAMMLTYEQVNMNSKNVNLEEYY
jgi:hypothetical protein